MSSSRTWLAYAAGAVICFFLGAELWYAPGVGHAFIGGGVLLTIGAVLHAWRARPDPYDLRTLQDLHEREEAQSLEVPDASEIDQVHCLCCQQVYAARFPACPYCSERKRRRV